jgi:uncharacterized damage-inducible protein DinB
MAFADYASLEKLQTLSHRFRDEIAEFLQGNIAELKEKIVSVSWDEDEYTADEIVHHIIAHEIHHIGQLSIWSRELNLNPVPASYIGRNF